MKIFLISQDEKKGYDTYDSAVVVALNSEIAREMHPSTGGNINWGMGLSNWCSTPDGVNVDYIGEASSEMKQGVICSSFNAG